MSRLVMKFGGTSVADMECIRNVARHVKREVDAGHQVAVVLSAMAGTTNMLVGLCREAGLLHEKAPTVSISKIQAASLPARPPLLCA